MGVPENPGQQDSTYTKLDRAYVDFNFPRFDITLGKQHIATGVSYLWAPLDVYNRVNIFNPAEEKLENRDGDQNHTVRRTDSGRDIH